MEKDYYKKYLKYKLKYNKLNGGKVLGINEKPLIFKYSNLINKIKLISLESDDIIKEFDKIKTFGEFFEKYNKEYKDKIKYYEEKLHSYIYNGKTYKLGYGYNDKFSKVKDPFEKLSYLERRYDYKEDLYHDDEKQKQIIDEKQKQIIDEKNEQENIKKELDRQFKIAYKEDYTLYKKDTTLYKLFLNQKLNGDTDYIIFDRYSTLFNLSSFILMNDINMFYNYKTKNHKIAGYFNYYTFNTPSPYYYTTQLDEEKQIFSTYIQKLYFNEEIKLGNIPNLEIINTENLTNIIKKVLNNIFDINKFVNKNFTFFLKFLFVENHTDDDINIKTYYKKYYDDVDINTLFKTFNIEEQQSDEPTSENKSILNKLLINITNLFIEKILNNYNEHLLIINNLILQFINNKIHIKENLTFENIEEILNILQEILINPEKYDIELNNLYSNIYYHISQIFSIEYQTYLSDKFIILIYKLLDDIKIKINNLLIKYIFKELLSINYVYYILNYYSTNYEDDDDYAYGDYNIKLSELNETINKNSINFKLNSNKIIQEIEIDNILNLKQIIYYKYTKYLFYSYLIFLIENNLYSMINPNSLIINKDIFKYCFHTQIKIPRKYFDNIIYFNGTDETKIKIINIFIDPKKTSLHEDIEDYKNFYINKPYINLYWLNNSDEVKNFKNIIRDIRNYCTINFKALELLYNDKNVICSHNLTIGPENINNNYFNKSSSIKKCRFIF